MKIVISNYKDGAIYEEIAEPTSSQISVYPSVDIISIDGEDFFVEATVLDHNKQELDILVLPENE